MNNKSGCPCAGCVPPKRYSGCHGNCPEYIKWNGNRLTRKSKVSKARSVDWDITNYVVKAVKRVKHEKETESTRRR